MRYRSENIYRLLTKKEGNVIATDVKFDETGLRFSDVKNRAEQLHMLHDEGDEEKEKSIGS